MVYTTPFWSGVCGFSLLFQQSLGSLGKLFHGDKKNAPLEFQEELFLKTIF